MGDSVGDGLKKASLACDQSKDHQWRVLASDELESWLALYPPDERCLTDVSYSHGSLRGTIRPQTATYTMADVPYLTATQLTLVASQSGYLLSGAALCDREYVAAPIAYYDLFLQRLRAVQLYYTHLSFRFRRPLSNVIPQPLVLSLSDTQVRFRTLFARFYLDCGNAGATASMTLAMRLWRGNG